ncbi:MAG TPA: hypothetical protein VFW29_02160 [Solirubrobacteraceae bacterium]|nr:hypothetical protein [Solirubrobacteraceae bacterium]
MSKLFRSKALRRFAITVFGVLAVGGAIPGTASAALAPSCASTSSSMPFARFLDLSRYTAVSGGSFENGAPGWTLERAGVVSGNESYSVAGGSSSLAIAAGGEASSPAFCAAIEQPTFRFFARNVSGHGALNVSVRYTNNEGDVHTIPVASLGLASGVLSNTSWSVSPVELLDLQVPMLAESLGSQLQVELVFQATGGAWQIDDVYYDPYSR